MPQRVQIIRTFESRSKDLFSLDGYLQQTVHVSLFQFAVFTSRSEQRELTLLVSVCTRNT